MTRRTRKMKNRQMHDALTNKRIPPNKEVIIVDNAIDWVKKMGYAVVRPKVPVLAMLGMILLIALSMMAHAQAPNLIYAGNNLIDNHVNFNNNTQVDTGAGIHLFVNPAVATTQTGINITQEVRIIYPGAVTDNITLIYVYTGKLENINFYTQKIQQFAYTMPNATNGTVYNYVNQSVLTDISSQVTDITPELSSLFNTDNISFYQMQNGRLGTGAMTDTIVKFTPQGHDLNGEWGILAYDSTTQGNITNAISSGNYIFDDPNWNSTYLDFESFVSYYQAAENAQPYYKGEVIHFSCNSSVQNITVVNVSFNTYSGGVDPTEGRIVDYATNNTLANATIYSRGLATFNYNITCGKNYTVVSGNHGNNAYQGYINGYTYPVTLGNYMTFVADAENYSGGGSDGWQIQYNQATSLNNLTLQITLNPLPVPPVFSNEIVPSGDYYNLTQLYIFNISISGSNGNAGMEFGGVNYTLTNGTTNNFTVNLSGLTIKTYKYYYWSYGAGGYNTSGIEYFIVAYPPGTNVLFIYDFSTQANIILYIFMVLLVTAIFIFLNKGVGGILYIVLGIMAMINKELLLGLIVTIGGISAVFIFPEK